MTYSHTSRGLGALPGCTWSERQDTFIEHGQTWWRLGIETAKYREFERRMQLLKFPTGLVTVGSQRLIRGASGIGAGVYDAYMRFGARHPWWVCNLTSPCEEGAALDHGCALRVHVDLYRVIMGQGVSPIPAGSPWWPTADGYVRVVGGNNPAARDGLMDVLVSRLIAGGFLAPLERSETIAARVARLFSGNAFSGGYSGELIGMREPKTGFWAAWNALRRPGLWPGGSESLGEGPGTQSRELRIHKDFLIRLLQPLPAESQRLSGVRTWRHTGGFGAA